MSIGTPGRVRPMFSSLRFRVGMWVFPLALRAYIRIGKWIGLRLIWLDLDWNRYFEISSTMGLLYVPLIGLRNDLRSKEIRFHSPAVIAQVLFTDLRRDPEQARAIVAAIQREREEWATKHPRRV